MLLCIGCIYVLFKDLATHHVELIWTVTLHRTLKGCFLDLLCSGSVSGGAERVPDDIVVRHKKYLVFKHIYPSRSIKPPQVLLQTQPQRRETPIMYDYTVLFYYPTLCHHGPCDLLICRSPPSFCSVVTLHKGKRSMKIQLTCK